MALFVKRIFTPANILKIRTISTSTTFLGQNVIPKPYQDPQCKRLQGKVAVVTASTEGIGYAIAERFCQEGAQVVISSRKQENVDRAVKSLSDAGHSVVGVPCHVGKAEDRKNLLQVALDNFGSADILVSNAAVNPSTSSLLECSTKAWDKIFEINVTSSLMLAQLFAPYMLEKKTDCSILFITSFVAFKPMSEISAYSVSKTALMGLTRAIAKELALTNVRVNSLAPGNVLTRFADPSHGLRKSFLAQGYDVPPDQVDTTVSEMNQQLVNSIPAKRSAVAHEMAGTAAFLCSEDASYVTAENMNTAGGFFSRL